MSTALPEPLLPARRQPIGLTAIAERLCSSIAAVLLAAVMILGGASSASASLLHLVGPVPADLGVHQGHLSACPSPAHCARQSWPVPDPQVALRQLLPAVLALEGVDVVESGADYLHATAVSRLFGFVDDFELHADPSAGLIEARSVSRLGDSDLGVNARRLERLHEALQAL